MSSLLSKYYLCVCYNNSIYYFGMWKSYKYFKADICIAIKINGEIYYLPLMWKKLMDSSYLATLRLMFFSDELVEHYAPFTRKSTADYYNYDTLNISYSTNPSKPYLYITFQLATSEWQRKLLNYHVTITRIKSSGGKYYDDRWKQPTFLEDFYLEYPTKAVVLGDYEGIQRKVFDSDVIGFKNYSEYTECGTTYTTPEFPDYEVLRITCDVCDGYIDVTIPYNQTASQSQIVKIPIREGTSWSIEK